MWSQMGASLCRRPRAAMAKKESQQVTNEQKIIAATATATAVATADIEARINTQSQAHAQAMLPSIIESVKQWIKNGELVKIVIEASPKDSSSSVSFIGNPSPWLLLMLLRKTLCVIS